MSSMKNKSSANEMSMAKTMSVARCVGVLSKDFKHFCDRMLEPYGLTNGLYFYLLCVYYRPGITLTQVRDFFQEDKSYTTRSIARLEEMGVLSKTRHQNDGRSWCLELTEEGRDMMEVIRDLPGRWYAALENSMGIEKTKQLEQLLNEACECLTCK